MRECYLNLNMVLIQFGTKLKKCWFKPFEELLTIRCLKGGGGNQEDTKRSGGKFLATHPACKLVRKHFLQRATVSKEKTLVKSSDSSVCSPGEEQRSPRQPRLPRFLRKYTRDQSLVESSWGQTDFADRVWATWPGRPRYQTSQFLQSTLLSSETENLSR